MANTTKKKTDAATDEIESFDTKTVDEVETPIKKAAATPRVLEKIDPNELIDVQSCTYGELIYISKKTGYKIIWDDFGSINMMTVGDLIDMRNGQRRFFEEPFVVLLGDRAQVIMDYLQVSKYYKKFNKLEDFDEIFKYKPSEIEGVLKDASNGTKEAIARRAYALIKSGDLDSQKMIAAIETATGFYIKD